MDALPDIPLFPLPGHVLLPGLPTPYHVFEPRYRALVADLAGRPPEQRLLAVPRVRPGHEADAAGAPPLCPVVSLARLTSIVALPDGRSLVVALGDGRWRLDEQPSGRPYRMARLERLPEAAAAVLPAAVQDLVRCVLGRRQGVHEEVAALLDLDRHPAPLVLDRIASLVLVDPDLRQRYLETDSAPCRLRLLTGCACRGSGRLAVVLN